MFVSFVCLVTALSPTRGEGGTVSVLFIVVFVGLSHTKFSFSVLYDYVDFQSPSLPGLGSSIAHYSFLGPHFKIQVAHYGLAALAQVPIPDSDSWVQGSGVM